MQRSFIIGDNWLYYKLYTGPKTSDRILIEIIHPIVNELLKQKIITQWFFIRYEDPESHIRVRFYLSNHQNLPLVIDSFRLPFKKYLNDDILWKVQIDTYTREIERYGYNTIEYSEKIFFYDSKMTVNFLTLIEKDVEDEIRWLFGLKSIAYLLNDFQYSDEAKLDLLKVMKTNFSNEFNMSRPLKKQLDDKYRIYGAKIDEFMHYVDHPESTFSEMNTLLDLRSKSNQYLATKILALEKQQRLEISLNNLISNYIHMLMNRLFKSKNRLHEMVCYDFLFRFYKSKIARGKYQDT